MRRITSLVLLIAIVLIASTSVNARPEKDDFKSFARKFSTAVIKHKLSDLQSMLPMTIRGCEDDDHFPMNREDLIKEITSHPKIEIDRRNPEITVWVEQGHVSYTFRFDPANGYRLLCATVGSNSGM